MLPDLRKVTVCRLPRPLWGSVEQSKDVEPYVRCRYVDNVSLHEYLGGPNFAPIKPHPVTGETLPVTLGHEFSGVVKKAGPGTDFRIGDQVVVQPSIFCSACIACRAGAENVCDKSGFIGLSGGGGGLSDAVCVPQDAVLHLPENIPLDVGALVEILAVAWHAVSAAPSLRP